jgi:hypothetical protein
VLLTNLSQGVGVVGRDAKDFNSLKLGAAERKPAVMRPEVIDNLGFGKLEVIDGAGRNV